MYWGMSVYEFFAVIMFALAFNAACYFALKYAKEKRKNKGG